MRSFRQAIVGLCALAATGTAAAAFIELDIPTFTSKLQDLTNGAAYPTSGPLTAGGVPFHIAQDADGNNMWEAFTQPVNTLVIPVNMFGVVNAYTLMDSFFGICGTTIGTVRFLGSAGGDVTFDLVEGQNIRDHFTNPTFCGDIAPGTPSIDFGSDVHLDRQTFMLPATFATQTLTSITITSFQLAGAGDPFITSATVETAAVPEPSVLSILGLSLAGLGWSRRRK